MEIVQIASEAGLVYVDSSALVKIVVREPESDALIGFLRSWPERVSSALARVEVLRAVKRVGAPRRVAQRAAAALDRISLIRIDEPVLRLAADLEPVALRSLDAIHLATALSLGDDLGAMVTYDADLARAAREARLSVFEPAPQRP